MDKKQGQQGQDPLLEQALLQLGPKEEDPQVREDRLLELALIELGLKEREPQEQKQEAQEQGLQTQKPQEQGLQTQEPQEPGLQTQKPQEQVPQAQETQEQDPQVREDRLLELALIELGLKEREPQEQTQEAQEQGLQTQEAQEQGLQTQKPQEQGLQTQEPQEQGLQTQEPQEQGLQTQKPQEQVPQAQETQEQDPQVREDRLLELALIELGLKERKPQEQKQEAQEQGLQTQETQEQGLQTQEPQEQGLQTQEPQEQETQEQGPQAQESQEQDHQYLEGESQALLQEQEPEITDIEPDWPPGKEVDILIQNPLTVKNDGKAIGFSFQIVVENGGEVLPLPKSDHVRRTFLDFMWLREILKLRHDPEMIPPLRKKFRMEYKIEFYYTVKQQRSMCEFTEGCFRRKELALDPVLWLFYQSDLDTDELGEFEEKIYDDEDEGHEEFLAEIWAKNGITKTPELDYWDRVTSDDYYYEVISKPKVPPQPKPEPKGFRKFLSKITGFFTVPY